MRVTGDVTIHVDEEIELGDRSVAGAINLIEERLREQVAKGVTDLDATRLSFRPVVKWEKP